MFKVTEFVWFMLISGSEDRTVTSVSAESDIRKFEKVMSPISSFECELNECLLFSLFALVASVYQSLNDSVYLPLHEMHNYSEA